MKRFAIAAAGVVLVVTLGGWNFVAPVSAEEKEKKPATVEYDYQIIVHAGMQDLDATSGKKLQEDMNKLGKQGFELVVVNTVPSYVTQSSARTFAGTTTTTNTIKPARTILYFKRKK